MTQSKVRNADLINSSLTVSGVSGVTGGGTVALGSAITLGMADSVANTLAGYNSSGVFSDVSIGSNLSLSGGILSATSGGGGSVSSVFGRTGAVTAQWNDYQFNLIGGTATASQGGTGLATLTAHAVMLGEGVSNVSFATTGIAARILIDQGNADPSFQVLSGDSSLSSTGNMVNLAVHGVTYGANPSTNTVPVVTSSNVVTYEAVPNAALANSTITIGAQTGLAGGGSVALGSAITLGMGTSVANTLAGYNNSGVFADVSIGSNLSLIAGVLNGTVGPAPVTSVFGRTGAVVAAGGDYSFGLISGTAAVSQGGTGAGSFTAHSVLLGEGTSAVAAATTGTSGRLLIDQGAADPTFKIISGGATLNNSGTLTLSNPSASSLGGVNSISAITHNFIIGISTSGLPTLSQPAFTDLTGAITTAQLPSNQTFREIAFSLDGQGLPISAISGFNTWYLSCIPYAGTITGWNIVADTAGSIDIDVWKKNASVPDVSNTITASAQCSLLSSQSIFSGPITGWTSAISKGDVFAFNLISASSVTKANLTIQVSAS